MKLTAKQIVFFVSQESPYGACFDEVSCELKLFTRGTNISFVAKVFDFLKVMFLDLSFTKVKDDFNMLE